MNLICVTKYEDEDAHQKNKWQVHENGIFLGHIYRERDRDGTDSFEYRVEKRHQYDRPNVSRRLHITELSQIVKGDPKDAFKKLVKELEYRANQK